MQPKQFKSPIYRITILDNSHFPIPIHKEDVIIFSDSQEQVFETLNKCKETINVLDNYNIKYKLKVE